MHRCAAFLLAALALVGLAGAPLGQTFEFSTVANVSATMGVNDGRICIGEESRQDIGCPTYAPFVSTLGRVGIGTNSPLRVLDISGSTRIINTSTTQHSLEITGFGGSNAFYIGKRSPNSSSLLSIVYGSGPGNNNGLLMNQSGSIGLGGTPNASLTVIAGEIQTATSGMACTTALAGAIRFTGGNLSFCNGVSATWTLIGGAAGGTPAGVSGSIQFNSGGSFAGRSDVYIDNNGSLVGNYIFSAGANAGYGFADRFNSLSSTAILRANNRTKIIDNSLGDQFVIDNTNGNVGISVANPNAKLEVAGRVSASVVQVSQDPNACTTATLGTIRRDPATGRLQHCRL